MEAMGNRDASKIFVSPVATEFSKAIVRYERHNKVRFSPILITIGWNRGMEKH